VAVRQVSVQAPQDAMGARTLQAFVLPEEGQAPSIAALRRYLRERIPEYMIPTSFVMLDAFPLTPSGKIDGLALIELGRAQASAEQDYVAPRTLFERDIAGIWAEVLKVERVGALDSFFDLGGHSLLVMQVISRLREAFDVELTARDLFEASTVASLAELVEERFLVSETDDELAKMLAEIEEMSADAAEMEAELEADMKEFEADWNE
jgi:acyl carrier protein